MQLHLEQQLNPVADEVAAITAVVRPILTGLLHSLKIDVVNEAGGVENVKLMMLPRLYRPGDGDCGICFEYAVHDALSRGEASVTERIEDALVRFCAVPGDNPASILFGAEKTGALGLIATVEDRLTDNSRLMSGSRGQPVKLKKHIRSVAAAFRRQTARQTLPSSIRGLWKADLFVGHQNTDKWVGTTVKINPSQLVGARGLRVGIVPVRQNRSDAVRLDSGRNLIICPVPYDGAFMETFYVGWAVVQQFIAADALLPREVALPRPVERQVARYLADRREFPVLDVIEALGPLAQPELLRTCEQAVEVDEQRDETVTQTNAVVVPMPTLLTP